MPKDGKVGSPRSHRFGGACSLLNPVVEGYAPARV